MKTKGYFNRRTMTIEEFSVRKHKTPLEIDWAEQSPPNESQLMNVKS